VCEIWDGLTSLCKDFLVFFLSFLLFFYLSLPYRFYLLIVGTEGYCYNWSYWVTHSVGLLWTRDRPVAESSTFKTHNTYKRQTSMPPAGFEPAISAASQSAFNRCTVQPFTESDDTRCCVNTIFPPEDVHVNARYMSRIIV